MILVGPAWFIQAFSYSAGGIFPQAEWSLSSLYQATHSAVATVTCPVSCHVARRAVLTVPLKLTLEAAVPSRSHPIADCSLCSIGSLWDGS
jgi:hypothetical protein